MFKKEIILTDMPCLTALESVNHTQRSVTVLKIEAEILIRDTIDTH